MYIKLLDPVGDFPIGYILPVDQREDGNYILYTSFENGGYVRHERDILTITHEIVKYTIRDIVEMCETVDAEKDCAWSDCMTGLIRELGFHDSDSDTITYTEGNANSLNAMFSMKYAKQWLCTDTYVGFGIMYYDGEPLSFHHQPGRKYDVRHYLISNDVASNARKFIQSLLEIQEPITAFGLDYEITGGVYVQLN